MLPRHPDQYTNEELETWIRHLVDDQVSEGPMLDYKDGAAVTFDRMPGQEKRKARQEAAKDISSFANEVGGVVVYGISEDRQSGETAIPTKPYGMGPIPGLEETLENIYVDSLAPRLPEYRIRKVPLTEYPDKVVYIVWTPESWVGPHMVQSYADQRHYRRGQLRAIPMNEYEIRGKYEGSQRFRSAAYEFANSDEARFALSRRLSQEPHQTYCLVVPLMLMPNRVDFNNPRLQTWLRQELLFPAGTDQTSWVSSYYGVNSATGSPRPHPNAGGSYAEIYRNGAVNCIHRTAYRKKNDMLYLYPVELIQRFREFTRFCGEFMSQIAYLGPLLIRMELSNGTDYQFQSGPDAPEIGTAVSADGHLRFDLEETGATLASQPNAVVETMKGLLFQAFGVAQSLQGRPS